MNFEDCLAVGAIVALTLAVIISSEYCPRTGRRQPLNPGTKLLIWLGALMVFLSIYLRSFHP